MKLAAHTEFSLFEELESEWNELLHRSYTDRIFSTWEWNSTWWSAYQPGQLWVLTCRDDDRLLGIAPWFIDETGTLRGIGCVDVTDYIDVIVDKDCVNEVLNCFASYLSQHRDAYESLGLCNIPADSPTYKSFSEILKRHEISTEWVQADVCPVIELPDDWKTYLDGLDKKQRHEIRRKLRRANGAGDAMDWYIVGPEHDLEQEYQQFLRLMAASDQEKAEFLENDKNVAFFDALVPLAHEKGWLQLNFIKVGDEPAAAYMNFDYNRHILIYNSGLERERFDHLSPGIVLLAHNIRWAIENHYEVLDFLRGDEHYKYRMGGKDTFVYTLQSN